MPLYRLVSVKYSRREHKRDETGKLMYKDEDHKVPIYELKSYGVGQTVDLSPSEARRMKNDIKPIGGTADQPTPLQFVPDDSKGSGNEDEMDDDEMNEILAGNVPEVLAYIDDNADNDEILEALRKAEASDKKRKSVLEKLDELLGE